MRLNMHRVVQGTPGGSLSGMVASVSIHGALVAAAVISTGVAEMPPEDSGWTRVIYLAPPAVPTSAVRQTAITYVGIGGNSTENSSPAIDETDGTEAALDTDREGLVLTTVSEAPVAVEEEPIFLASQVENPAAYDPGSAAPAYPELLRAQSIEGQALVQFVVDSSGAADTTSFTVLVATHQEFVAAVRTALPRMRFAPAEQNGARVRQLVEIPFTFKIQTPPPLIVSDSVPR